VKPRPFAPTWRHRAAIDAIANGADLRRTNGVTEAVLLDLRHEGFVDFETAFVDYPRLTDAGRELAAPLVKRAS